MGSKALPSTRYVPTICVNFFRLFDEPNKLRQKRCFKGCCQWSILLVVGKCICILTEILEALAYTYCLDHHWDHFNLKSPKQKNVLTVYNIIATNTTTAATTYIWCLPQQGCAASGRISKEDAAFVCVEALECIPQTGFILEVANGENKVLDWKECLATLMEKASQQPQWPFTRHVYSYFNSSCARWSLMGLYSIWERRALCFFLTSVMNQLCKELELLQKNMNHCILYL